MTYNKPYLEKVFSPERMKHYFSLHPNDESHAISHYQCNLLLSEAMYQSLSVFEVALRNAICRELTVMAGQDDWYTIFLKDPDLEKLYLEITHASMLIEKRKEQICPSKITAELTLGFWVALFNVNYQGVLWKHLRRVFPYMPKKLKQRKEISSRLNRLRKFRNRVFHHEPICWDLDKVNDIHDELITLLGWMDKELPGWLALSDRFHDVSETIRERLKMLR